MRRAFSVVAAYTAIAVVLTWPLALSLGRDVAWDLGDPVLNMWILSWDCHQIAGVLRGDFSRIGHFFDANIFYPAPLSLAYSEHLFSQAIQFCPIYAVTGNPILGYNLLFLSTFVLSGFGTFLLVRELTGKAAAAFVGGLLFGFALYRVPQSSHLQVLSSQWMPLTLYGLRRYFATRRFRPLLGGALSLVAQNLSCGYYLLYFSPFAAAYGLWELGHRRLWRDRRVWLHLTAASALVVAGTLPFLLPYADVRARFDFSRPAAEISGYSADVYAYVTASVAHRVWGGIAQAQPRPEGELFPGLVPVALALIGVMWGGTSASARPAPPAPGGRVPRWLIAFLVAASVLHMGAVALVVVLRRVVVDFGLFELRIVDADQMLLRGVVAFLLLLFVSPPARIRTALFMRERGVFLVFLLSAFWLSLGPTPHVLGRPLDLAAPYGWLLEHAPGFDGLRVPARFAMIVALMLAVLGGYGAAALLRWRHGTLWLTALAAAFLVEGHALPFLTNGMTSPAGFATPEPRLRLPARAPAVYREVSRLPPETALIELPIGSPDFDLRAMFYSTVHWRPLLNGYSGFFPRHYGELVVALSDVPRHPDVAWEALRAAGATHAIVHEAIYLGSTGAATSATLRRLGAVEVFRDGPDVLFDLAPRH